MKIVWIFLRNSAQLEVSIDLATKIIHRIRFSFLLKSILKCLWNVEQSSCENSPVDDQKKKNLRELTHDLYIFLAS